MRRNNLTVLGTALVILGTALVISVMTLSNVSAGTQTPGEDAPVVTEADIEEVIAAESYYWADQVAQAEAEYPAHILAAAAARYAFQETGEYMDQAYWQDLIGEDVFGWLNLEADGTVTIEYVGKEPDLSILPAQFTYNLVPVDKTLAERIADPEPFDDFGEDQINWSP